MDVNKVTTSLIANESQMQQAKKKARRHSLDLVFTLAKEALDAQLEEGEKLDSKADSIQVSATAVLGAALVLEAVLIPLNDSFIIRIIQVALLLPLLTVHVVVMYNVSGALEISNYRGIHPKTLILKYLKVSESETKQALLRVMMHEYEDNEKIIDKKVKYITKAHRWRSVEAAILAVVLLVQVISVLFIHGIT